MSHIDEVRLHEYLDGLERPDAATAGRQDGRTAEVEAHLAECAECAALLEEVQLIRDRAATLLRDAAPVHVSMPPFEEIQARAEARARKAPRRVFAMNRLTALGWAATIVLAVGVGWLARGSFNFGSSEPEELRQREVAALEVEAPAAAMDVASGAEEADRGAPVPAQQEATGRRSAHEPVEEEVTTPPMTDERLQMAVAPPAEPERTEILAEPSANVAEPEQPAAAKADAMVAGGVVAGGVVADEEQREARGRGAAVPDIDAQVNEAFAQETWVAADRSAAERHLGRALLTVEGLPVAGVRVGEVSGLPAVLVLQTLPSGDSLDLVQWRQADAGLQAPKWAAVSADRVAEEAVPEPRAREGASVTDMTVIARDGFLVALRAAVSRDSLAALAGRIR